MLREEMEPPNLGEIIGASKKLKSIKKCNSPISLHHECSQTIINAHSVSKCLGLHDIACDGHVLEVVPTMSGLIKSEGMIAPQRIGVNKASTFSGFCAHHDKKLFSPLEDRDFEATREQLFLLAYRAVCREKYAKEGALAFYAESRKLDKGMSRLGQFFLQKVLAQGAKREELSLIDLNFLKERFDMGLLNKDHSETAHFVVHADALPCVLGCSVFAPEFDFHGERVQTLSMDEKKIPSYLMLNVLSSQGKGYFILSWIKEHENVALRVIRSLRKIAQESWVEALSKLALGRCENVFLSPRWWASLNPELQKYVIALIRNEVSHRMADSFAVEGPQITVGQVAGTLNI